MDTRYWVKVAWDRLNDRGINPTIKEVADLAIELKEREEGDRNEKTSTD
jgi:hypothetical protein